MTAVSQRMFQKDATFTELRGRSSDVSIDGKKSIKLMTWNVYGLETDMLPSLQRTRLIAERILRANPDVVILEECFGQKLVEGIWDHLNGSYAHAFYHSQHETKLSSGLAIFSKLPIGELSFQKHPNSLYKKPQASMGTVVFSIIDNKGDPMAAIAASHFQGSSSCQWRVGQTKTGERLSYPEVRRQQAQTALDRLVPFSSQGVSTYLCADSNVERNSDLFQDEYEHSPLNPSNNPSIQDAMTPKMRQLPTNTNFWCHHHKIALFYPDFDSKTILEIARVFEKLSNTTLKHELLQCSPWNEPDSFSRFDPSWLSELVKKLNPQTENEKRALQYFCQEALNAIQSEKEFWKEHNNPGDCPPVSIGWVLWSRATPIQESLDTILGVGPNAYVSEVKIVEGFNQNLNTTASDHHGLIARIQVGKRGGDKKRSLLGFLWKV